MLLRTEHDENRVVAGNGPDNFGPLFPIERDGDGLGATRQQFDDEKVVDSIGPKVEGREQTCERRRRVGYVGGDGVGGPAFVVRYLYQAQLTDVPGEGRLGDIDTSLGEKFTQDFLRSDTRVPDDIEDFSVALGLQHFGK